jgi:hypothetical protein
MFMLKPCRIDLSACKFASKAIPINNFNFDLSCATTTSITKHFTFRFISQVKMEPNQNITTEHADVVQNLFDLKANIQNIVKKYGLEKEVTLNAMYFVIHQFPLYSQI